MAEARQFQYENFARSTVAATFGVADTELVVQPSDAHLFPPAEAVYLEIFALILSTPGVFDVEIVYVTGKVGNVFTVERAKEGTVARTWVAGVDVVNSITAQLFSDIVESGPRQVDAFVLLSNQSTGYLDHQFSTNPGLGGLWVGRQKPAVISTQVVYCSLIDRFVLASSQTGRSINISDNGGYSWEQRQNVDDGWQSIAYSPTLNLPIGRLVMLGNNGTTAGMKVATSDDGGDTWTQRATPAFMNSKSWTTCTWDPINERFCANSSAGGITSADGITWVESDTSAGGINSIKSGATALDGPVAGRTVFANTSDLSNVYTDDGGVNFVGVPNPNGWAGGNGAMAWGGPVGERVFVACSAGNIGFESSPNGITWTNRSLPAGWDSTSQYGVILWSEDQGLFIAHQQSTDTPNGVVTSPDGITWTGVDGSIPTGVNRSFASGAIGKVSLKRFRQEIVVVEDVAADNRVVTSEDGYNWATSNTAVLTTAAKSVAWSPSLGSQGRFCLVGDGGKTETSDDGGLTWTTRTAAEAKDLQDILWSATLSLFVAVVDDGAGTTAIATSPNGIDWTARTTGSGWTLFSIAEDGAGNLVAAGNGPTLFRDALFSSDGITWTECSEDCVALGGNGVAVGYDTTRSRFILFSNTETGFYSTDGGDTWTDTSAAFLGHSLVESDTEVLHIGGLVDRILLSASTGMLESDDGGLTWANVNYQGKDTMSGRTSMVRMNNGRLLSTALGGVARIIYSDDDGDTWYQGSTPAATFGIWQSVATGRIIEVEP